MRLRQLYEAKARRIVAVMPGGFHPFHPGHKSLYDWAVKTFGQKNVYVAATNDTKARPFPFEVKKKLAAMAGVPENNFIQVKSPFNLNSYKDMLGDDAAIVFVRSQKDKNEQPLPDQTKKNGEPGYLRSYTGKDLNTADEMGYMAYGPTINFDFSGMQIKSASELRATWPEMSDEDKLKAAELMYGNGAPVAVKLLNQALEDPEAPVGEDASPDEEDEFHRKLDKLVHKTFGHSSDEKKKKKKTDEIMAFGIKSSPKRATIKKKPEKFEPSLRDKIAARRKAAAQGDKDAWASKKELPTKEAQLDEIAPALAAPIAIPVITGLARWAVGVGGKKALRYLAQSALGATGIVSSLEDTDSNFEEIIDQEDYVPGSEGPSTRGGQRGSRDKSLRRKVELLLAELIGDDLLQLLLKAGITLVAIYVIYKGSRYLYKQYKDGKLEKELEQLIKDAASDKVVK